MPFSNLINIGDDLRISLFFTWSERTHGRLELAHVDAARPIGIEQVERLAALRLLLVQALLRVALAGAAIPTDSPKNSRGGRPFSKATREME